MKTWTGRQIFTNVTLFVLLVSRIFAENIVAYCLQLYNVRAVPPTLMLGVESIQNWIYYFFLNWSFILAAIAILINRSNLTSLNIDVPFLALFSVGGLAYWVYYRWTTGWIALFVPFAMYIFYRKQEFKSVKVEPVCAQKTTIILVVVFLLGLLLLRPDYITNIFWIIHSVAIQFPFILVEEVIFRGLLWKFMTNLNWSGPKIVGLQAFLFWLSHSRYMISDPIYFWITVPIAGIILGIIVWRSGSLTVSLFAHIFYNFLS